MKFVIYNQSIKQDEGLLAYIFDALKENLSFLYGDNMITPEARQSWLNNNLLNTDLYWRIVVAYDKDTPCGFLIYTLQNNAFVVNDIEINKPFRHNPVLLRGLFRSAFALEKGKWTILKGYINHKNTLSKNNFLKLATSLTENKNGISLETTKEVIQKKFFISDDGI